VQLLSFEVTPFAQQKHVMDSGAYIVHYAYNTLKNVKKHFKKTIFLALI